jgi:CMP-N,N'-diacetyllegionaminic acid synthase
LAAPSPYRFLFLITARGGSKGIPGKNTKPLKGKPLIHYSIDLSRSLAADEDICVSTDSAEIKMVAEQTGLTVPFLRPAALALDTSGSYEVIVDALDHYEKKGRSYDAVVLLQPTSPLRTAAQVKEAMELFTPALDLVTSVKESKVNPYYNLFEENKNGFLELSKPSAYTRRQDCPPAYEQNGAIYVFNVKSLRQQHSNDFKRIKKYVMDERSSVDLDTPVDWAWCEYLMNN